ncbi:diguanylate cyclase [Hydrogenimonas sp.]
MKNLLKNINLLYVEDDKEIAEEMICILKMEIGIDHIFHATNGQEGLKLFRENDIDLIVADIMTPVMNGLEMSKKIKEIDPSVSIIIVSAFSEVSYLQKAIEVGVDNYILKPINIKSFLNIVEKSALNLQQKRQIKEYALLSEMLMDTTSNLIFAISDNRVIFKNRSLSNKLDIDEKSNDNFSLCDYILNIDGSRKFKKEKEMLSYFLDKKSEQVIYMRKDIKNPRSALDIYDVNVMYIETSDKYLVVFTDITRIYNEKERYKLESFTDRLTNVKNKHYFKHIFHKMIDNAKFDNRYKLSLIMLDIDHFKKINDTYGHQTGDKVLKSLAQLVRKMLREDDIFVRWGGEEFTILCNFDINAAIGLAERLREHIQLHKFETIDRLTCSFGVATFCKNDDKSTLFDRADKALYRAKNSGRNRVEYIECASAKKDD